MLSFFLTELIHTQTHTHTHIFIHPCTYMHPLEHMHAHTCTHIHIHAPMYTHTLTQTPAHTHTNTQACAHTHSISINPQTQVSTYLINGSSSILDIFIMLMFIIFGQLFPTNNRFLHVTIT